MMIILYVYYQILILDAYNHLIDMLTDDEIDESFLDKDY